MSTLTERIKWLHQPKPQITNGDVDPGIGNAQELYEKNYGTVKITPLSRVQIFPGVIAYDEPLLAADGAPITSTGPYQWGQLYAAGRY